MTTAVARTCTEITGEDRRPAATGSRPIGEFRSAAAYVLLGDPGAGKTTEFQRECGALGEAAEFVSARDFLALDVDSRPEWRDRTLFIDGLDERRAGAVDARTPLDAIRGRLDNLGRPRFRISCRQADWLGWNDRESLKAVSPDSQITVLRLDPLSEQAAGELLKTRIPNDDVQGFVREAGLRGLDSLLGNPLTLLLLAGVGGQQGRWPESRLETFEMACRRMATELNDEHRAGSAVRSAPSAEAVLDAAGHLCALQLLAGVEGYSRAARIERPEPFVPLDDLVSASECPSRDDLKDALATPLFTGAGETSFRPLHRQVAEFLAGRYLAKRIRAGLPACRVVALMTGAGDGRVVTALRGLSAWLAAHSDEARRELIDADPVGVGLYGDIEGFTTADKKRLLESLAAFATEAPLSESWSPSGSVFEFPPDSAWAFKALVSPDTLPLIDELLRGRGGEDRDDRVLEFVLAVLAEADETRIESLAALTSAVEAILRDAVRSPEVRRQALDAYLHLAPAGAAKTQIILRLLDAVHGRQLSDPDDEICGTLLQEFYPGTVTPAQVWRYVVPRNSPNFYARFWRFWMSTILDRSSGQDVAELLGALSEDADWLIPALRQSNFEGLPLRLLVGGLEAAGGDLEPERLYDWLRTVAQFRVRSSTREDAHQVRAWLEARPKTQKEVFLWWLRERNSDNPLPATARWRCVALHESRLPADFGLWCLDRAVDLVNAEPAVAQDLLGWAHGSLQDPSTSRGLTLNVLRERTREHVTLAQRVDWLCERRSSDAPTTRDSPFRELDARRERAAEDQRQRREEWADAIREREAELRENRFSPPDLDTLANAYLGLAVEVDESRSPRDRIAQFVGDDRRNIDAVIAGLREAVTRADVPESEETISLLAESQRSWLAYAVLASLDLLNKEDPARLDGLDDARKQGALAIHYCVPTYGGPLDRQTPSWHDRWLEQDPKLVLDVLYRCAVAAVRRGKESPPGLATLDGVAGYDDLVHDVRLRLLKAYPTRAPNKQIGLLDGLLSVVLAYPDKSALRALVDKKLSSTSMAVAQRVRWLAVAALLMPGSNSALLKEWAGENETRVRHLAEFFSNIGHLADYSNNTAGRSGRCASILEEMQDPAVLRHVIELLGFSFHPVTPQLGPGSLALDTFILVSGLVARLGSLAGEEARDALTELIDDPRLTPWKGHLTTALEGQRVIHRDASFIHPDIEQVQCTLSDEAPANAADLAALLTDRLRDIANDVRGGSSNLWRQFWNEGPHGDPIGEKPENSCRDALLAALRGCLPHDVDVAPEGRYAAETRADIRASSGGFNLPIEIKKQSSPDLWSALRVQLIGRYTTDPATSGYGIFLVLWFGEGKTTRPPHGSRPTTTAELAQRLEQDLTPQEARKTSVIVVDVTKPGS